jgi:beta-1,2-mannobiose phosphorylase / 1,2-beta-oligomannan phosphorylase
MNITRLAAVAVLAVASVPAQNRNAVCASRRPLAAVPARRMMFGDTTRRGKPFAKDPSVIRFGGRYLMYYSIQPYGDGRPGDGWAIGIAASQNLVDWERAGEILPAHDYEAKGLVNGRAILLDGKVHLFYNTYGNGQKDAVCHAVSSDGIHFTRNASNPILRASGGWNSGRAIDVDVIELDRRLLLYYATRDPSAKVQMLAVAAAPRHSDFGREQWKQLLDGPVLKPELPWETNCIEAPSLVRRGKNIYLFYGGGYNNDPQQIGCAVSTDGVHFRRLFTEPLIPNGKPGEWNASETGHPGYFEDCDHTPYLFVQGNQDKGKTWFLSFYRLGWGKNGKPFVAR